MFRKEGKTRIDLEDDRITEDSNEEAAELSKQVHTRRRQTRSLTGNLVAIILRSECLNSICLRTVYTEDFGYVAGISNLWQIIGR